MSEWTNPIPTVKDGDPVNAANANKSALALSERTIALKAMLDAATAGKHLILTNIVLSDDVVDGDIVYLNFDNLKHEPALAQWQPLEQDNDAAYPADSAIYTGVVIRKGGNSGDVLMSGVGRLTDAARDSLMGADPERGVYYLSSLNPGKAEFDKPAMTVRAFQYMGDNLIHVYPASHDPVTHQHLHFLLDPNDWLPAGNFTDPPAGATYGLDLTSAFNVEQNIAEALLPGVGEATFINLSNGTHIVNGVLFKDENGIWSKGGASPTSEVDMHVQSADVKDMAVVHTIKSDSKVITVTNYNGRVTLDFAGFEEEEGSGSLVINDIVDGKKYRSHVVGAIKIGMGLVMQSTETGDDDEGKGTVTLTAAVFDNYPVHAARVNLNNAVTNVEGSLVITQFPQGRESSANYLVTLPDFKDGNYIGRLWAQVVSPVANMAPPEAVYNLIETPDAAGVAPGADQQAVFPQLPASVNAGEIYYIEAPTNIDLTNLSRGHIAYKLFADEPPQDIQILATGVRILTDPGA